MTALRLRNVTGQVISGQTFASVHLDNCENVTLEGCTIDSPPLATSNGQAVRIVNSRGVTLRNCDVIGKPATVGVPFDALWPDKTGNVIGLPSGKGVNVERTSGFTMTACRVRGFHKAVTFNDAQVTIDGCDLWNLRTTPISGVPRSGSRFTNNYTWDSKPWRYGADQSDGGHDGDHGDGLHLWTAKTPISGIVIEGNSFSLDGMMGVYIDDNRKSLGFRNIVILRNRITGRHGSGILLENTTGLIADNHLQWDGIGREWNDAPRIIVADKSHDLTISGTRAIGYTRPSVDLTSKTLTDADRATITVQTGSARGIA